MDNDNSNNNNKMQNHHHPPPSGPRAVSRSAMVKAVVASESLEQPENHGVDNKPVKNVCLVDTPQIFPTGNAMTTRAVIGNIIILTLRKNFFSLPKFAPFLFLQNPHQDPLMSITWHQIILKESTECHVRQHHSHFYVNHSVADLL